MANILFLTSFSLVADLRRSGQRQARIRVSGWHIRRDGKRKKMRCFYAVIAIRLLFSSRKGNPLQWYPR